jgi:hypothetical protein
MQNKTNEIENKRCEMQKIYYEIQKIRCEM